MKKVECELSLIQKMVSHVVWEVGSDAGEYGEKLVLEGLGVPLSIIATMVVRTRWKFIFWSYSMTRFNLVLTSLSSI